jgi:hypothetical protein
MYRKIITFIGVTNSRFEKHKCLSRHPINSKLPVIRVYGKFVTSVTVNTQKISFRVKEWGRWAALLVAAYRTTRMIGVHAIALILVKT